MSKRGVNRVIILGNLGDDPTTNYMPNGNAVTKMSIATSESWKDKTSGQEQERTEWHRVVAFNRLAEIMGEYLRKGSKVYIEGSLRTNKWQDKEGNDRYTTEIIASDLQMLDSRGESGDSKQSQANTQTDRQPPAQQSPSDTPQKVLNEMNGSDFEDDIPF